MGGDQSRRSQRFDPALNLRDDKEEARVGNLDHRYNHWTAVRDALMNAHADVFPQVPAIVKTLPDPIDQMKLFELIQIIPSPTKSALRFRQSAQLPGFRPDDHGISAQQQHVRLWTGRQGKDIRDLPRNSRCDVAVQSPNSNRRFRNSTRSRRGKRSEQAAARLPASRLGNAVTGWCHSRLVLRLSAMHVRCWSGSSDRTEITLGEVGIAVVSGKFARVRLWRLAAPPRHHRRDGRVAASADRGQPCRLAVGCLQGLVKAGKSPNASHLAKARRRRRSRCSLPAKPAASPKRHAVKLAAPKPAASSPSASKPAAPSCDPAKFRIVLDVGHTAESGRRDQRPQRRRVRLQPAAGAADRREIEGRRLCRDQVAADRRQGEGQPGQACRRGQQSARESVPVDPP